MSTLSVVSPFKTFVDAFSSHSESFFSDHKTLYQVQLSKDVIRQTYLESFPEENGVRQSFNCNACFSFLLRYAGIVKIREDSTLESLWNFQVLDPTYSAVISRLRELVEGATIAGLFYAENSALGLHRRNFELLDSGDAIERHHFFATLPKRHPSLSLPHTQNENYVLLRRALAELTPEALDLAYELAPQINTGALGDIQRILGSFITVQSVYHQLEDSKKNNYLWSLCFNDALCRIRNSATGTLLIDLSSGVELNKAVHSFETKVNGSNYRRPTALVTAGMIKQARKKITELGLEKSLQFRHATEADFPVTQVLFVDRSIRPRLSGGDIFDQMISDVQRQPQQLKATRQVNVKTFLDEIVPQAEEIEFFFEPTQVSNLVTLVAPVNQDSPVLTKWSNGLTWTYNGSVADPVAERIKQLGGDIEGEFAFRLAWNHNKNDQNVDLDAHCTVPGGSHIYFANKKAGGGELDVDIQRPGANLAVENITWQNIVPGKYKFWVHNFRGYPSREGFTAQLVFKGQVFHFEYSKSLKGNENVTVCEVELSNAEVKVTSDILVQGPQTNVWGLQTGQFHPVKIVSFSPNHWEEPGHGTKNLFFFLKDAQTEQFTRGFYNNFLPQELSGHGKVLEVLAAKSAVPPVSAEEQLSGVGIPLNRSGKFVVSVKSKNIQQVIEVQI